MACVTLAALLLPLMLAACETSPRQKQRALPAYASFRDVPGVTGDEIQAIEALQKQHAAFVFGMRPGNPEAFTKENGEIGGYAALLCGWLTKLFAVPFKPALYTRDDLLEGLKRHEIDFTGELTDTKQHREIYHMTGAIAERPAKYLRIAGSAPFADIAASRPLRFAFLNGDATADAIASRTQHPFESIFVDTFEAAYSLLKSGQIDAFLTEGGTEAAFDAYSDVVAQDFFPLTFSMVSLATQNPSLQPLISVVQKALRHDADRHLAELYKLGRQEYMRHKLFMQFSTEEKAYIRNKPVVRFAAEHYNYPISFYNKYEEQWQGIAFDVLKEVEDLTALSFERVNNQYADWPELLEMLENGTVSMITELVRNEVWAERFLLSKGSLLSGHFALLSKSTFPALSMSEVEHVNVGLTQATSYAALFRNWFPNHAHTTEYESSDAAFAALDRGEVDVVMSSRRRLLALTNYHEITGYKANIVFERAAQSVLGFRKDEAVLCSIVDKALNLIDVERISASWTYKTYDYQGKLARAQRPWLIGASGLLVCVLILLIVLFQRTRHEGKTLEELVRKRTRELEMRSAELGNQHALMTMVNDAAVLLLDLDAGEYRRALNRSMEIICRYIEADRVYLWQNIRREDGKLYYRQVCKWANEETKMDDDLAEFAYQDTLPSWEELLARGETLNGPLDSLPEGTQAFFSAFQLQLQSLLVVPLFLRGEFWGFVSFDDCHKRRVFPEAEGYALRSWGLLAVGAIQRGEIAQGMLQTLTKLEAIIKNYKGVIWSIDTNGVITTFNGRYLETLGIQPSFIEGKTLECARRKGRHLDIIANVEKTFHEGPQDWIGEIDGGVFRSSTVLMRDALGNLTGIVGSTDDVTEMIKLQRELKTAVQAAEVANQAKSAFLANMSHEIRTPMNVILGITELQLHDETLAPNIRAAFGMIYNSGDLLLSIINDILDMSRIEAGKLELAPAAYEVASLINDAVRLNIMRIDSKPVEFTLHVDENTPAMVVGDVLRVKQILNNLLSNAFKYTAQGMVTLSLSSETGQEDGVTLVFTVSDTGQGMTEEQLSKLFDAYVRFNQDANRTIEGVGLGMSITQNLVRLMNGEILVESKPARGSTFTVRLPQSYAGPDVLGREAVDQLRHFRIDSSTQISRRQLVREPMPYGTVLVVDDVETNLYVATGLLAFYDLMVDSADSAFAAIEKIKQGKEYDVVFMDHMMPGMDGIEATKIIRSLGYTRPVVALTANAMLGRAEMFLENGFDDFIAKPIDLRYMNALLNKFVRNAHPPEVVEAARRQAKSASEQEAGARRHLSANPNLAKSFVRDASKALALLETLCEKQDAYSDADMQAYVVSIHGMKSALDNIGEPELACLASTLEQAARTQNTAVMSSETPVFLNALREVIEKITPKDKDEGEDHEITEEDRAYLHEKLRTLQAACAAYDKKTAKTVQRAIEQKAWPRQIRKRLDTIANLLLHSKFKKIVSAVDAMIPML